MTQDERIEAVLLNHASPDILSDEDLLEIKIRVFNAIGKKMNSVGQSECLH